MATTAQNEAAMRSSVIAEAVIPANGVYSLSQYGEAFHLILATDTVYIKTGDTAERPYVKGTGERFPIDFRFSRLEIWNHTAQDITIRIWAGFGQYIDTRADLTENPTIAIGQPAESLAAGATLDLPGSPNAERMRRKALVVSNLDPTNHLKIIDAQLHTVCAVFPLTSITLPISGDVKVRNNTGSAIACYISEIWYTYK